MVVTHMSEIKNLNKQLRSIDLFAGIGGIRMGFDQAFGDSIPHLTHT